MFKSDGLAIFPAPAGNVPTLTTGITAKFYSAAGTPLPAASVAYQGQQAVVSDATAPTYMAAYTSGGTITCSVICSYNGTTYSWLTN